MLDTTDYKNAEQFFFFFEEISKIPHVSNNTAKISEYLVNFANERGLWCMRDESDNVIIRKKATKGYESHPTVIFQAHTDMVADKAEGSTLDMNTEGLKIFREGDFIRAEGTTLGADDGTGVAYMLAVLDSDNIEHPEFEALFTSNEEIGLLGAQALDTSHLHGKILVNLDGDTEGCFTAGCAGGTTLDITLPYEKKESGDKLFKITVSGLTGGHSGSDINKGKINAIKLLSELLPESLSFRIAEISGGNADNAIPQYAECIISTDSPEILKDKIIPEVIGKYIEKEPAMAVDVAPVCDTLKCYSKSDSAKIVEIIKALPYGVHKMSEDMPGLVETSSNPGVIKSVQGKTVITLSIRSSKDEEKQSLKNTVCNFLRKYGAEISEHGEYPAWEYKKDSPLRSIMSEIYTDMYGKAPECIITHAGLECGVLSSKIKGLDCINMGPDEFDIHTHKEKFSVSSAARVWEYLKAVLRKI